MNYLDFIIIALLIISAIVGFMKGLIHQLASLTAWILGIYLSVKFSRMAGNWLAMQTSIQENTATVISFFVILVGIIVLIHLLGKFLETIFEESEMGSLNRMAGSLFSIIKTVFVLSVIFVVLNFTRDYWSIIPQKHKENSFLYSPIESIAPAVFPYFKHEKNPETRNEKFI